MHPLERTVIESHIPAETLRAALSKDAWQKTAALSGKTETTDQTKEMAHELFLVFRVLGGIACVRDHPVPAIDTAFRHASRLISKHAPELSGRLFIGSFDLLEWHDAAFTHGEIKHIKELLNGISKHSRARVVDRGTRRIPRRSNRPALFPWFGELPCSSHDHLLPSTSEIDSAHKGET